MDFKQIKPAVSQYIGNLKKKLPIERVILFGSFAAEKASKDSDVDLLIISKKFAEMNDDQRSEFLYRQSVEFPYDLHVYGLTPKEFAQASSLSTLGEIKKTGIEI
jgi:predicted nucleotidyltransferase